MEKNSSVAKLVKNRMKFPYRNSSSLNIFNSTEYLIQELGLWAYIIYMSSVFLMVVSFLINALVLRALRRMGPDSLTSSFLIQGIILSDILVSLALGTQILPYVLLAFGCDPVLSISCYWGFSMNTTTILVIIQLYTGLAVAVDRLLSVLRPLKYHATDYSAFQKTIILGGIWVATLALYLSVIITDLGKQMKEDTRHMCLVHRELPMVKRVLNSYITPGLMSVAIFATLSVYLAMLRKIIKQRASRCRLTESTNTPQDSNASLALTLFLIHLTYLLCYLPNLVQFVFFREKLKVEGLPGFNITACALTSTIYQCNTIIDPLIFTWRIRFLRNYMWSLLRNGSRRQPHRTCISN